VSGRVRRRALAALAAVSGLVVLGALGGTLYLLSLPSVGDAPARVAAILRAHGGTSVGTIPPYRLGQAVVDVEDENFYSNVFYNVFAGAARAALATLHTSGDPGGSTIDQQLAKQLYPESGGLEGVLHEIGIGVKLDLRFSKPRILAMYLDAVYFGNGYWGAQAAARGYFGANANQLSWAEAAMLAGLPQAPSAYDPVHHLALAKERQRQVLDQLVVNHVLTAAQAAAAYAEPLPLRPGATAGP
jgi:membrane peptidoglycan carboxypeptidase